MAHPLPGPILGYTHKPDGSRRYYTYPGDKPIFTTASNRTGKSASVIWPNLITYGAGPNGGSMVVTDLKGEHCAAFARWRSERLKQDVLAFDPFSRIDDADLPMVNGKPSRATFNPLDLVRLSPNAVATAKMLSAACLPATSEKPFFSNSSRNSLAAWMVFIACDPVWSGPRDFGALWHILNLDDPPSRPVAAGEPPPPLSELQMLLAAMSVSTIQNGFCAREANRLRSGRGDTMRDIRSTIHAGLGAILDDPDIIDSMAITSPVLGYGPLLRRIDAADDAALALAHNPDDPGARRVAEEAAADADAAREEARRNCGFARIQRRPMTVFLCLPGNFMDSHGTWARLLLSCILAGIEDAGLPSPGSERARTLLICDECFSMGPMDQLLGSYSRLPGYGVTLWPFFQDLTQPRTLYGEKWETFMDQAGVVQAFGNPRGFTAEYLSKLTGQITANTVSDNWNSNPLAGTSRTKGEALRPAKFPDEITRLDPFPRGRPKQLLFYEGLPFKITERLLYWEDFPEFVAFLERQRTSRPQPAPEPETPEAPSISDPYAVLGISPEMSDEEARAVWKHVVRENHPDTLAARGLPPAFIAKTVDRVALVNAAWDMIRAERRIR